jgi:ParB/RepB/Spo0J family partition protein
MFSATRRVGDLRDSIASEGQQIPIIVRSAGDDDRYQIVSGFRRATATRQLGLETISAIVRHDLADDEAAFRTAVIENEQRQTYNDIDRALVILRYQQAGWTSFDIAELMGLRRRQLLNIRSLLDLPTSIQAAIDNPDHHFGATHGIELGRLLRSYPQLDIAGWISRVNDERLSVAKMKREVGRAHKPTTPPPLGSIFNDKATDRAKGIFRFDAVKVVVADLDNQERKQLRAELEELLAALG